VTARALQPTRELWDALRALVGSLPPFEALAALPEGERPALDLTTVTESYLAFLAEQIQLGARGPEWTRVLEARRRALEGHMGEELLRLSLRKPGGGEIVVRLRPGSLEVIHREEL
jgi:hypothetical protein